MCDHTTSTPPCKPCTKCKRILPLNEFHSDPRKPLGVSSHCRACHREYRANNKRKLWQSTRQYRTNNPDYDRKRKAWNAMYYALRMGKITKPETCSICGGWFGSKIQAHHEDYDQPLEVVWCCQDCHVKLDAERREKETTRD